MQTEKNNDVATNHREGYMPKISVYIIAYNEEHKIENALRSVQWADEIVVIDSFSTDSTVEIARKYTDRIVQVPFEGFGKLRQSAIAATSNEWIFSLDTDERCTELARKEIEAILQRKDAADVYYVPRRNIFMGKWIKHCGWYPDYRQPQLFKKGTLLFNDDLVHEGYTIQGTVGYMKNYIVQVPYRNLSQLLGKLERYTTLGAGKLAAKGKRATMPQALLHALGGFLRIYFLKLGFLDGWPGFVLAFSNFEATFFKYAKKVELQQQWKEPDTY